MRILNEIYNKDGISQKEIAQNLRKRIQEVDRMAGYLVGMGYIKSEVIRSEKIYPMTKKKVYFLVQKQKSRALNKIREELGDESANGNDENINTNQETQD